ncbi:MAG: hypothetical protein M1819_007057 [Sarea resinae]|nr:MAG: hypothetical protein M1819_007057 [Sarea resinae]
MEGPSSRSSMPEGKTDAVSRGAVKPPAVEIGNGFVNLSANESDSLPRALDGSRKLGMNEDPDSMKEPLTTSRSHTCSKQMRISQIINKDDRVSGNSQPRGKAGGSPRSENVANTNRANGTSNGFRRSPRETIEASEAVVLDERSGNQSNSSFADQSRRSPSHAQNEENGISAGLIDYSPYAPHDWPSPYLNPSRESAAITPPGLQLDSGEELQGVTSKSIHDAPDQTGPTDKVPHAKDRSERLRKILSDDKTYQLYDCSSPFPIPSPNSGKAATTNSTILKTNSSNASGSAVPQTRDVLGGLSPRCATATAESPSNLQPRLTDDSGSAVMQNGHSSTTPKSSECENTSPSVILSSCMNCGKRLFKHTQKGKLQRLCSRCRGGAFTEPFRIVPVGASAPASWMSESPAPSGASPETRAPEAQKRFMTSESKLSSINSQMVKSKGLPPKAAKKSAPSTGGISVFKGLQFAKKGTKKPSLEPQKHKTSPPVSKASKALRNVSDHPPLRDHEINGSERPSTEAEDPRIAELQVLKATIRSLEEQVQDSHRNQYALKQELDSATKNQIEAMRGNELAFERSQAKLEECKAVANEELEKKLAEKSEELKERDNEIQRLRIDQRLQGEKHGKQKQERLNCVVAARSKDKEVSEDRDLAMVENEMPDRPTTESSDSTMQERSLVHQTIPEQAAPDQASDKAIFSKDTEEARLESEIVHLRQRLYDISSPRVIPPVPEWLVIPPRNELDRLRKEAITLRQRLIVAQYENSHPNRGVEFSAEVNFFEEYPKFKPNSMFFDAEAKMEEIKARPSRKQTFGKLLASARTFRKNVHCEVERGLPMPHRAYAYDHESGNDENGERDSEEEVSARRSRRIKGSRSAGVPVAATEPQYKLSSGENNDAGPPLAFEELIGMPKNPIPVLHERKLAFRDGTLGANGQLPRAKAFYPISGGGASA